MGHILTPNLCQTKQIVLQNREVTKRYFPKMQENLRQLTWDKTSHKQAKKSFYSVKAGAICEKCL